MNYILRILFIFLIQGSFEAEGAQKTYAEMLESIKSQEKLVFDISTLLNDKLETEGFDFIHQESLDGTGIRLSPTSYYSIRGGPYYDSEAAYISKESVQELVQGIWKEPPYCSAIMIDGKFHQDQPLNMTIPLGNMSIDNFLENRETSLINPFTLIFNVYAHNFEYPGPNKWENFRELITAVKSKWKGVKMGIQYDYDNYLEVYKELVPLRNLVDVAILNVDILTSDIFLSYSRFRRNLQEIVNLQLEFFQTEDPNRINYLSLNAPVWSELDVQLTDELYHKYFYYFLQLSVLWANEDDSTRLIVPSFLKVISNESARGLDGTDLGKMFSVSIDHKLILEFGTCEIKAMMDQISQNFKSITIFIKAGTENHILRFLSNETDKCILTNSANCAKDKMESEVCNRPQGKSTLPDFNVLYTIEQDLNIEDELIHLNNILRGLPWNQFGLSLFGKPDTDFFRSFASQQLSSDVQLTCFVEFPQDDNIIMADERFIEDIKKLCNFMWDDSKTIAWMGILDSSKNKDSLRWLLTIERRRQKFLQQFPDKSVELIFYDKSFGPAKELASVEADLLYCNAERLNFYEIAEHAVTFALIHNFSVMAPVPFSYFKNHHGWLPLTTVDELNMSHIKFPHFVARNFPDKFLLGDFPTDPCITWTREVPKNGIEIDSDYGGATLYLGWIKNGSVNSQELQVMLQFALHKFSLLEIIPETTEDLKTVLHVVSLKEFAEIIKLQNKEPSKLYLRIDLNHFKTMNELSYYVGDSNKGGLNLTGITFTNWQKFQSLDVGVLKELQQNGNLVGIELEECVEEVNNRFQVVRSFQLLSQMDYILCNFKHPAKPRNSDKGKVAKYLDTTLYIQKYFHRMFPNISDSKTVMFRLNTEPTKVYSAITQTDEEKSRLKNGISFFLKFFSDVSQYARLYKLKFFMFPAFDNMNGSQFGWWAISNFENLSDSSIFLEKQADYLGEETWRPPQGAQQVKQEWDGFALIILGFCVFIVLLTIVVVLIVIWYRTRISLLTKDEIDQFWHGSNEEGPGKEFTFDSKKFPKKFAIPRNKFVLLNIIGRGNFGFVYNATLTDFGGEVDVPVAVKIPRPGCSKEAFKCMLAEVKILSYVGCHPHVLEFVGAYMKEIGRGIAYIATELCQKGSLQDYLREWHSCLLEGVEGAELPVLQPNNLYELYRFGHEVAQGMEYIAGRKIVHGDLSTRNVLLDFNLVCKIGDFGLSRKLYEYQEYVKTKDGVLELPWRWLSIESLTRLEFSVKSDAWSFGVTLWEIFSLGNVPYPGLQWSETFLENLTNGYRMSAPSYSTTSIYEEMKRCWEMNPNERPTFSELAQFFSIVRNKEYVSVVSS